MVSGYREQWNRTKRWLKKFEGANPLIMPNCDDVVYAFFQNSWHLKDWIKNDESIPIETRKSVERIVKSYPARILCADLANGSKHLALKNPRSGVVAPTLVQSLKIVGGDSSKTRLDYEVMCDDGTRVQALDIAHEVQAAWLDIFAMLRLTIDLS
jgi:hypothetical protein